MTMSENVRGQRYNFLQDIVVKCNTLKCILKDNQCNDAKIWVMWENGSC